MITKYQHRNVTWIDLESPTSEEVRKIMEEYEIHPNVAEELLFPSLKPKVEVSEDYIYLILHFPAFKHSHVLSQNQEVDFIIGKNVLITTRYDVIDPMHKFAKVFEVNSILHKNDIGEHAGYLFFHMITKLYKSLEHELESIRDTLEEIEEKIFEGREKEMVFELSFVSRDLLNFKQALALHREILESFEIAGRKFFGENFSYQLQSILAEYYRVQSSVKTNTASLRELRETNNALLTTKQNEIMKVLTILAFVTFPLSLVASIFGMNTKVLPLVGHRYDFWIIIGTMFLFTITFFMFFRYKKWL